MSKITKATVKSFIKKNEGNLYIRVKSSFDGMTDCVQQLEGGFRETKKPEDRIVRRPDYSLPKVMSSPQTIDTVILGVDENNLGAEGVYVVGGSGNLFTAYDDGTFEGFEIYNCCGSQIIAKKKTKSLYAPVEGY